MILQVGAVGCWKFSIKVSNQKSHHFFLVLFFYVSISFFLNSFNIFFQVLLVWPFFLCKKIRHFRTILGTFFISFSAGFWKPDWPTQFHEIAPAVGAMLPHCHIAIFVLIDNLHGKLCFCGSFSGLKYFKSSTDCNSYLTSCFGEFQQLDHKTSLLFIYLHM